MKMMKVWWFGGVGNVRAVFKGWCVCNDYRNAKPYQNVIVFFRSGKKHMPISKNNLYSFKPSKKELFERRIKDAKEIISRHVYFSKKYKKDMECETESAGTAKEYLCDLEKQFNEWKEGKK